MSRSGGEALLGVSATAVAVLLIVFLVYSNFDRSPATVGDFDVVVEFEEEVESRGSLADLVAAQDGVARTVIASRIPVEGDFSSVYTMTCADVPGSVTLDGAPCAAGLLYIPRLSQVQGDAIVAANDPQWFGGPANDLAQAIAGAYPVAGTVSASWITSEHRALLIVDEQPTAEYGVLLVTTDGSDGSLRGVMRSLRNRHGVNAVTTQAALASGVTEDTLILDPYLWVVAITASGLATVALFYAVLLLFRQRQIEFNMLRAQGATQTLLAVDLGLLFAMPLVLAFGLAVAAGMVMATAFNAGLGLPTPYASTQAVPALATMLAVGMTAAVLVAVRATRIPTLLSDPDAGAA